MAARFFSRARSTAVRKFIFDSNPRKIIPIAFARESGYFLIV
jgi:hypothetical protein